MAQSPIQEGRVERKFKKIKADFFIEEGKIYFMTEEDSEKRDLAEALEKFDGEFCQLSITNEVKYDSLDEAE